MVTWKGRLIAERYGDGVGVHTPLESWSITATLFGILLRKGVYELTQRAPIWQRCRGRTEKQLFCVTINMAVEVDAGVAVAQNPASQISLV